MKTPNLGVLLEQLLPALKKRPNLVVAAYVDGRHRLFDAVDLFAFDCVFLATRACCF